MVGVTRAAVCPAAASLGQEIGPRCPRSSLVEPEDRLARWVLVMARYVVLLRFGGL